MNLNLIFRYDLLFKALGQLIKSLLYSNILFNIFSLTENLKVGFLSKALIRCNKVIWKESIRILKSLFSLNSKALIFKQQIR
jgi:hypothetical protein